MSFSSHCPKWFEASEGQIQIRRNWTKLMYFCLYQHHLGITWLYVFEPCISFGVHIFLWCRDVADVGLLVEIINVPLEVLVLKWAHNFPLVKFFVPPPHSHPCHPLTWDFSLYKRQVPSLQVICPDNVFLSCSIFLVTTRPLAHVDIRGLVELPNPAVEARWHQIDVCDQHIPTGQKERAALLIVRFCIHVILITYSQMVRNNWGTNTNRIVVPTFVQHYNCVMPQQICPIHIRHHWMFFANRSLSLSLWNDSTFVRAKHMTTYDVWVYVSFLMGKLNVFSNYKMTNPNMCEMVESLRYLESGFELAMCIDNVIFNTYHFANWMAPLQKKCKMHAFTTDNSYWMCQIFVFRCCFDSEKFEIIFCIGILRKQIATTWKKTMMFSPCKRDHR